VTLILEDMQELVANAGVLELVPAQDRGSQCNATLFFWDAKQNSLMASTSPYFRGNVPTTIAYRADTDHGWSGSPVVNSHGEVFGVHVQADYDVNAKSWNRGTALDSIAHMQRMIIFQQKEGHTVRTSSTTGSRGWGREDDGQEQRWEENSLRSDDDGSYLEDNRYVTKYARLDPEEARAAYLAEKHEANMRYREAEAALYEAEQRHYIDEPDIDLLDDERLVEFRVNVWNARMEDEALDRQYTDYRYSTPATRREGISGERSVTQALPFIFHVVERWVYIFRTIPGGYVYKRVATTLANLTIPQPCNMRRIGCDKEGFQPWQAGQPLYFLEGKFTFPLTSVTKKMHNMFQVVEHKLAIQRIAIDCYTCRIYLIVRAPMTWAFGNVSFTNDADYLVATELWMNLCGIVSKAQLGGCACVHVPKERLPELAAEFRDFKALTDAEILDLATKRANIVDTPCGDAQCGIATYGVCCHTNYSSQIRKNCKESCGAYQLAVATNHSSLQDQITNMRKMEVVIRGLTMARESLEKQVQELMSYRALPLPPKEGLTQVTVEDVTEPPKPNPAIMDAAPAPEARPVLKSPEVPAPAPLRRDTGAGVEETKQVTLPDFRYMAPEDKIDYLVGQIPLLTLGDWAGAWAEMRNRTQNFQLPSKKDFCATLNFYTPQHGLRYNRVLLLKAAISSTSAEGVRNALTKDQPAKRTTNQRGSQKRNGDKPQKSTPSPQPAQTPN
jgi:hypothetical protein